MPKKIFPVLLISLLLFGCGEEAPTEEVASQVDAFEVVKESYTQEYRTNGEIKAISSAPVATRNGGVVSEIKAQEGAWVEAGDVIFTYTTAGSENEAQIALQSAQDTLDATLSAANSAKISASQSVQIALQRLSSAQEEGGLAVKHAEENLKLVTDVYNETKKMSEQSIALAEQGLELSSISYQTAKNNLSNIEASTTLSLTQSQDNARRVTASVDGSVQSAIALLDEILGVSDLHRYSNDSYEQNLKAYDRNAFVYAQEILRGVLSNNQDWYKEENADTNYLQTYEQFIAQVQEALTSTEVILSKATTGGSFTETLRNSLRSSVSIAKQNVSTARQSVQGAIHTLESTDLNKDTQLTSARDAESSAEQALRNAEITLEQTRTSAQQALSGAEINLAQAKNALESTKVSTANAIEQARLSYNNAKTSQELVNSQQDASILSAQNNLKNLQNRYLDQLERAPVSGWLTAFELRVGEHIGANQVFATIVQTAESKVEFHIPTALASKVKLGDKGEVMCSDGDSGVEVSFVGVTATTSHTVKVEAKLDSTTSTNCRIGELAEIRISIEREPQIKIPANSFTWRANDAIAWVIDAESKLKIRKIKIEQILGNDAIIENGLEIGELIVVRPITDFREGQKVEIVNRIAYQNETPEEISEEVLESESDELHFGEQINEAQVQIKPTRKISE
jgi:RND family efflux transporter MFP subunit